MSISKIGLLVNDNIPVWTESLRSLGMNTADSPLAKVRKVRRFTGTAEGEQADKSESYKA
jgi:hypothetical protein